MLIDMREVKLTKEEKEEFIKLTKELSQKLQELQELQIKALQTMAELETRIPDLMTQIDTIYERLSKILTRMEAYWEEEERRILREIYGNNPPEFPDA